MQKQIEVVGNTMNSISSANCLIIANIREGTVMTNNLRLNKEMLVNISNSLGLKFDIVNLSLLEMHANGNSFSSNNNRIANFLNTIIDN